MKEFICTDRLQAPSCNRVIWPGEVFFLDESAEGVRLIQDNGARWVDISAADFISHFQEVLDVD